MISLPRALALGLVIAACARAEEPTAFNPFAAISLPRPDKPAREYPVTPIGASTGKVVYRDATREVSVAMCGVEGHGTAIDLDAGLLDYNVADPARGTSGLAAEPKEVGSKQFDYRSSVVFGVNVGYRF